MSKASKLINDRYRVVRKIGDGNFGATFLVEDTQLPSGKRCVLKELMPIDNNEETYTLIKQRFEREAVILEELGNVSLQIPSLYAYFGENSKFYLVQEYVEGETIAQRVMSQGVMTDAAVREWLSGLLPVLACVHEKRIIHRDIKPDNIILRSRDHKPVLIDFGAVRETMGTQINANGKSTQSIVIGTPGFMPSEQAAGRAVFSSDLYSLGLTAIYALTGKIPQELPTDPMTGDVQWRSYASSVSGGLANVIDRAISPGIQGRFQTSAQMLDALLVMDTPSVIHGRVESMPPNTSINIEALMLALSQQDESLPEDIERSIDRLKDAAFMKGDVEASEQIREVMRRYPEFNASYMAADRYLDSQHNAQHRTKALAATFPNPDRLQWIFYNQILNSHDWVNQAKTVTTAAQPTETNWDRMERALVMMTGGIFIGGSIAQIPGAIVVGIFAAIYGWCVSLGAKKSVRNR